jgi:hypothetical protein
MLFLLLYISMPISSFASSPTDTAYDLIVVGGEPEGVAAAVSAARNGAKTLLIEKRDGLGGLMTYGMLNFLDLSNEKNGLPTNAGIFKQWHEMVGGDVVFDVKQAKEAFYQLVSKERNITLLLNTSVEKVIKDQQAISGLVVKDNQGKETSYTAKRFIDCTQDGDFAAMAGAPFFMGGEDIGFKDRKMAVTLMIHFKDVDWAKVEKTAATGKFGPAHVDQSHAWGFGRIHQIYKPVESNTRVRGLNVARQKDGSIYINALQIFGVEGLNDDSKHEAIEKGKRETAHFLDYLKKEFPGFEQAKIADVPPELYVRETRHFYAEYQLPISDVWENKDHWDRISLAGYPVDVQATSVNDYGYVITAPKQYSIPFRSLVPKQINNLLIASRASGYSSLAAGSARVLPTGMSTGEAAGAAAKLSIDNQVTFRDMSRNHLLIEKLQEKLQNQGALLYPYTLAFPYEGKSYYPAIKTLLTYGLLCAGYDNNLKMDEPMSELELYNMLGSGISRVDIKAYEPLRAKIEIARSSASAKNPLTVQRAKQILQDLFPAIEVNLTNDLVLRNQGYPIIASILEKYEHKESGSLVTPHEKKAAITVSSPNKAASSISSTWIGKLLGMSSNWIDYLRIVWLELKSPIKSI